MIILHNLKVFFIWSNLISLLWTISLVISTLPSIRKKIENHVILNEDLRNYNNTSKGSELEYAFSAINFSSFCYFAVEILFRLLISPNRIKFVKNPLNFLDGLSIIAFFIVFLVFVIDQGRDIFIALRIIESIRMVCLIYI